MLFYSLLFHYYSLDGQKWQYSRRLAGSLYKNFCFANSLIFGRPQYCYCNCSTYNDSLAGFALADSPLIWQILFLEIAKLTISNPVKSAIAKLTLLAIQAALCWNLELFWLGFITWSPPWRKGKDMFLYGYTPQNFLGICLALTHCLDLDLNDQKTKHNFWR